MTHRRPAQALFADAHEAQSDSNNFGLMAWLEKTRVRLPLKGVECHFTVAGPLATVELDQIFLQDNDVPLDVTYLFPLPGEAAVYRCEMIVNQRLITARIESLEKAREDYKKAKQEGHRAGLVESQRPNLFQLSLGNVQPRDIIVMRLAFLVELERWTETVALRIPVCPGVKYIPGQRLLRSNCGRGVEDDTDQVPDASRITPPRIDQLHPDAATFYISGRMAKADLIDGSLQSPSHGIAVRDGQGGTALVSLIDCRHTPDRDFLLRWRRAPVAAGTARIVRAQGPDGAVALVTARAPRQASKTPQTAQNLWFLVDRSGSMAGGNWQQACRALQRIAGELPPDTLVFLTFFGSSFQVFAEKPLPAVALREDERFRTIETLGTNGGTEILPALQDTLARIATAKTGGHSIVLLTDGQVENEKAVIEALVRHPGVMLHAVGIDQAVNDAFLQELAKRSGGRCLLVHPGEDLVEATGTLVREISEPDVRDLVVQGGWQALPGTPAGLHQDADTSWILTHADGGATDPVVTGRCADGQTWTARLEIVPDAAGATALLAAKRRIQDCEAAKDEAGALLIAKRYNLLCEGAAFLAIDSTTAVPVAGRELFQPSMVVHEDRGMQMASRGSACPSQVLCEENHYGYYGGVVRESVSQTPARQNDARRSLETLLMSMDPAIKRMVKAFLRKLELHYGPDEEVIDLFCRAIADWLRQDQREDQFLDCFRIILKGRIAHHGSLVNLDRLLKAASSKRWPTNAVNQAELF